MTATKDEGIDMVNAMDWQGFTVVPAVSNDGAADGYVAVRFTPELLVYLAPDGSQHTAQHAHRYATPEAADAAIEAWQGQHQADAAHRGESEAK